MSTYLKGRVAMRLKCPNPLFEQWLTEWRDKAIESDSKMQYCFGKALQSLRQYPLPLESGRDCKILQGFGTKLCQMLDAKLKQHKLTLINSNSPSTSKAYNTQIDMPTQTNPRKNSRRTSNTTITKKEYIPAWRSGPYAILLTLYTKSLAPDFPGYLFKSDIVEHGQHLCDKSFVKPAPGSYYTAWSSMKILLEKQLVTKRSSPAKFSLTAEGRALAEKLDKVTETNDITDDELKQSSNVECMPKIEPSMDIEEEDVQDNTPTSSTSADETFIFTPHSFKIILFVDKQETAGGMKNPLDDYTFRELTNHNIEYEIKHLKIGDYTWICRHNTSNKELVLPYIIERKRMDDFGASIKDGRFHEQKFRLKQCGIQNLIYLIESHGNNTHIGLPLNTLHQAATNTLLQDGFDVKFTDELIGTTNYLVTFTTILKNIYEEKTLVSCPKQNLVNFKITDEIVSLMTFEEFNKSASKIRNFKVRDLFVRQLLQLKGMSIEKALAIVNKYPTPRALQMAYDKEGTKGDKMLSTLKFGQLQKKIGPVISNTIYHLYRSDKF